MQTETSTGEFRMVARATRRIQKDEEIFANYNNIGDETNAFKMPNVAETVFSLMRAI